jgi:NTE family protein
MAALMAIRIATGWEPDDSKVIIGTSGGAYVSALVRNHALTLDSLVLPQDEHGEVAQRIRDHVFTRDPGVHVRKWVAHGLRPGLRRPGLTFVLGSPAPHDAAGLADWVTAQIGEEAAHGWPEKPTAVVAYDLEARSRTVFGTEGSPDLGIADAVAASSAIPLIFRPFEALDRFYVDGGVASGTHADLVLGSEEELDLVLILAPMAVEVHRKRARGYEKMFDRVGQKSLADEQALIKDAWPNCDVVTLRPTPSVQNAMRPNPMDATRAVATFKRTLISMKRILAQPEIWDRLDDHLLEDTVDDTSAVGS